MPPRPAIRAGQGNARPFLLRRNDQFDPGFPLRLDSLKYHRALAEVEYIGATNSPRTAEQTGIAMTGRRGCGSRSWLPRLTLILFFRPIN